MPWLLIMFLIALEIAAKIITERHIHGTISEQRGTVKDALDHTDVFTLARRSDHFLFRNPGRPGAKSASRFDS